MSRRLGYVPALDGIRAIAVGLVVGYHYFGLAGGAVGVDLFFVLSGFLITTLLLEEQHLHGRVSLRGFYARRARRLFPALACLIAIYLVATTAAGQSRLVAAAVGASYVANAVTAFGTTLVLAHTPLLPLWSLAQEEQFYLVWPLLLLLLARSRRILHWIVLIALAVMVYRAALTLHGAAGLRIYYGPDTRADGLLVGAALAALRVRSGLHVGEWAGQLGVAALVPAALVGWQIRIWPIWGNPLFEVAMALLIAAAVSETEIARALSSKALVWVGKRSYGVYLWHVPMLLAVQFVMGGSLPARILGVAATLGVSAISYTYVEQPFRTGFPRFEAGYRRLLAGVLR